MTDFFINFGRIKKPYTYFELFLILFLLFIIIASILSFSFSIESKDKVDKIDDLLNIDDGTINLGDLDIRTTGNIFLPGPDAYVQIGPSSTFYRDGRVDDTNEDRGFQFPASVSFNDIYYRGSSDADLIRATGSELNLLDGALPGVPVPGKAVIYNQVGTEAEIITDRINVTKTTGFTINDSPIVSNFSIATEYQGNVTSSDMNNGSSIILSAGHGIHLLLDESGRGERVKNITVTNIGGISAGSGKITEIIAGDGLIGGGDVGPITLSVGTCVIKNGDKFVNGALVNPTISNGRIISQPLRFQQDPNSENYIGIRPNSNITQTVVITLPTSGGNQGDVLKRIDGEINQLGFGKVDLAEVGHNLTGGPINDDTTQIGVSTLLTEMKSIEFSDSRSASFPGANNSIFTIPISLDESEHNLYIKSGGVAIGFPFTEGENGNVLTDDGFGKLYWSDPVTTVKDDLGPLIISSEDGLVHRLEKNVHGNGRTLILKGRNTTRNILDPDNKIPYNLAVLQSLHIILPSIATGGNPGVYRFFIAKSSFYKITSAGSDDIFIGNVISAGKPYSDDFDNPDTGGVGADTASWSPHFPDGNKGIFLRYISRCDDVSLNPFNPQTKYLATGGDYGTEITIVETISGSRSYYSVSGTMYGYNCGTTSKFQLWDPFEEFTY